MSLASPASVAALKEYNTHIMPFFQGGQYELLVFDETNIPQRYVACLYDHKMPAHNPRALLMVEKSTRECVSSITFQPWILDDKAIEISSFTHVPYRKRGINFVMRLLSILLLRLMYPDSKRIISYAKSPYSAAADEKIGFEIYQSIGVLIYQLDLSPETMQRVSEMLVDRIARS